MTNLVPRKASFNLGALSAGARQIGAGGGGGDGRFLSIDHRTGAMTVGKEAAPFDTEALWAIRVEEIRWGYYVFTGDKAPDKSNMIPMVSGRPKPIPPGGYTRYPEDGPRDCVELKLHPVAGGEPIEFAPVSVSSQNRIANLVEKIGQQSMLPDGQMGFTNPVIRAFSHWYVNSYGKIWHFDFEVKDWTDDSGEVLLSAWRRQPQLAGSGAPPAAGSDEDRIDETLGFLKPAPKPDEAIDLDDLIG